MSETIENTGELERIYKINHQLESKLGEKYGLVERLEKELADQNAITELAVKENEQLKKVMKHIRNEAIEALNKPAMFYLVTALQAIKMEVEDAQT